LGVALLVSRLLERRGTASARALVLTAALTTVVVMPVISMLAPSVAIAMPAWPSGRERTLADGRLGQPLILTASRLEILSEVVAAPLATAATIRRDWAPALSAIWIGAMVLLLARLFVAAAAEARVRRRARRWDAPASVADLAADGIIPAGIALRISDDVFAPVVSGILRPVVLLPRDVDVWPAAHLRHALIHESAHLLRRDIVTLLVGRVACAVHWFNPLAWLVWRHLRLDIERACDAEVVVRGEAVTYAAQLVAMARRRQRPDAALAMAASDLAARVEAVLDSRPRPRSSPSRFAWQLALLAVVTTLAAIPIRIVAAQTGALQDLPPRPAPVPGGATISGVVYDPTGVPLSGLLLSIEEECLPGKRDCGYDTWTRSDRFGHYLVQGLPAGAFHIVSQIDFFPGIKFIVDKGETIERDITMVAEPLVSEFTVCAECVTTAVPDSLLKEFAADSQDALEHPVSAPRPANGWEIYTVGGGVYPPELRDAGIEGAVVVEGVVGVDGSLQRMKTDPSNTPLARAATTALSAELWEPARVRGTAIEVPFRFLVHYRLKP
ncbi:MAG: M56 family metallopeptidase, partial [Vicinamibacterales bacterium]